MWLPCVLFLSSLKSATEVYTQDHIVQGVFSYDACYTDFLTSPLTRVKPTQITGMLDSMVLHSVAPIYASIYALA